MQGRRVILVGLRDELAVISQTELLLRFGLTEVARVAFPKCGSWSLAANKGILESLDAALALAGGMEKSAEDRATGDSDRLASQGLAPVLELEVAQSAGPATPEPGSPGADCSNVA